MRVLNRTRSILRGGLKELWIDKDFIQWLYKFGKLDKYKELHCVKELVQSSDVVIFEGLMREGHEKSLCYAGLVSKAYNRNGEPIKPRQGETFTAYVTQDDKIFEWEFARADSNLTYPLDYQIRFGTRVWPKV